MNFFLVWKYRIMYKQNCWISDVILRFMEKSSLALWATWMHISFIHFLPHTHFKFSGYCGYYKKMRISLFWVFVYFSRLKIHYSTYVIMFSKYLVISIFSCHYITSIFTLFFLVRKLAKRFFQFFTFPISNDCQFDGEICFKQHFCGLHSWSSWSQSNKFFHANGSISSLLYFSHENDFRINHSPKASLSLITTISSDSLVIYKSFANDTNIIQTEPVRS